MCSGQPSYFLFRDGINMSKGKQRSLLLLIFITLVFFFWVWIFRDQPDMRRLGSDLFPAAGGAIAAFWLSQAMRQASGSRWIFWKWLTVGVVCFTLSKTLWLYTNFVPSHREFLSFIAPVFWLAAYLFYLVALAYKLQKMHRRYSGKLFIFNILIFMVMAIAFSVHYIMQPIIQVPGNELAAATVNLAFPIIDLCILLVVMNIFYLARFSEEKTMLSILGTGFCIQIIADTLYIILLGRGLYQPGELSDPLWVISLMLIGFSGHGAARMQRVVRNEEYESQDGGILPYLSIFLLVIFVIESNGWRWNMLLVALVLTISLFVLRQGVVILQNRRLLRDLWYTAHHDQLTGLANRVSFQNDLLEMLEEGRQDKRTAILFLDLDRFKNVNDTLGHEVGDKLLMACTTQLRTIVGRHGKIYRVGGDEFYMIFPDTTPERCKSIADHIIQSFSEPLIVDGYEISITSSIGISLYPDHGDDDQKLLRHADASMYLAKGLGRNNFQFYTEELDATLARKVKVEQALRRAIDNEELMLYYQPKINLQTRKLEGMEALLRWSSEELGFVSPGEFIPIAEETGQIVAIGEWVMKTACVQNKQWHRAGYPKLPVSVNVSVRQLQQADFIHNVKKTLRETQLDASYLELEITESIMQNIDISTRILEELQKFGIKTSLDDFGTGYSSLHVLKELPIDIIKIDKTFVDDMLRPTDKSILKAIINIGLNLGLTVVLEGIEEEAQMAGLKEFPEVIGQGYLFGRPVPPNDFERFFDEFDGGTKAII